MRVTTLHALVATQAERNPEAVALATDVAALSYRELIDRARLLAGRLRALGAGPEVPIGVCLRRGPRLIETLLAALEVGSAYVPLDPAYPEERLRFMIEDARSPLVVAESATLGRLPAGHFKILDLDGLPAFDLVAPEAEVGPGNLAYLIYTSGSTGRPKGVAIEHRAAVAFVDWAVEAFSRSELSGVLAATSIAFDLSIFEIFATLAAGGTVVLVRDALELVEHPQAGEWRRLTLVNTVPSVIAEVLRAKALPRGVRTVNLAGEALEGSLVEALYRLGHVERVANLYGPSEDTTYSTWTVVARGEPHPPIGRAITGGRAFVLDRGLRPLADEEVGELCLGGAGLARGYLRRPGLTAERFVPDPLGGAVGARLYRTGDLARWRADGELEFLGRIDHQVKLRGFRIELGEIEAVAAEIPGIERAVAVVHRPGTGPGVLVLYVRFSMESDSEQLRSVLAARLPAHLVPAAVVALEELPRTPSGKLDRGNLARRPLAAEIMAEPHGVPRTAEETALAEIWAEVLELPAVGVEDDFFALGGHSLLGIQVLSRVRRVFGVELPLGALLEARTITKLARQVATAERGAVLPEIPRLERRGGLPIVPVPLSFGQEQLWFLDRLMPGTASYHVPIAWHLEGPIDPGAIERALGEIVRRHEVLRTRYPLHDGRPIQAIDPPASLALPVVDLSGLGSGRAAARDRTLAVAARRPFDLARGPVLRLMLVRLGPEAAVLLAVFHHVAVDDASLEIFLDELAEPVRPEPAVQYADFAVWQRGRMTGELENRLLTFWRERLAGAPTLELTPDRPRGTARRRRAGSLELRLPAGLAAALGGVGARLGATRFMVLLAGWKLLLARLTGQDDLVLGSPVGGRAAEELEGTIGFFVNMVVLRTDLGGDPRLEEAVERVRHVALDALAHQEMPFERLVQRLGVERTADRNPLFQLSFAYQTPPRPRALLGSVRLEALRLVPGDVRFDLETSLWAEGEELAGELVYDRDLFDPTTVRRLAGLYRGALEALAAVPELRLSRLELLSAAERHQLCIEHNDTAASPPPSDVLGPLARHAAQRPDAVAVVLDERQLSYGELVRHAGALAQQLAAAGCGAEDLVGLLTEPAVEMVVAMVAVLSVGAAWLPIDPVWPVARRDFVLADARPRIVLATASLAAGLELPVGTTRMPLEPAVLGATPGEGLAARPAEGAKRAYVIYTSGSTGRPKGVEISRANLANLVSWSGRHFALTAGERTSQIAGLAFDATVLEIWPALAAGACVALAPSELRTAPPALLRWLAAERVTVAFLSTPVAEACLREPWPTQMALRAVIVGGDRLHGAALRPVPAALWNLYGPTETTVVATFSRVAAGVGDPPIGRPLGGYRVFVLDRRLTPLPLGAAGELYLGGAGIGRGYLGRPGLTAGRFIPDPFGFEPGGRFYKTGDLGRQRGDGEIEFLGRIDHQVKVRGVRIELGEIESVLVEHPQVAAAAVVVHRSSTGEVRLFAFVVGRFAAAELERHLGARLPSAMVPQIVELETLPLDPNRKVDRRALAAQAAALRATGGGERELLPPRTPQEAIVVELMAEVLELETVGTGESFFNLGGHSLLATQLAIRIERTFGVELPVRAIFDAPTAAGLARTLETAALRSPLPPIMPLARHAGLPAVELPLSFAQERLWFIDRLAGGAGEFYNVPLGWRMRGPRSVPALVASLREVVRRHEVLRTCYPVHGERPIQQVTSVVELPFAQIDLTALAPPAAAALVSGLARAEGMRRFDLATGPLLRALFLELGTEEAVLLLTFHHVVFDGWSVGVLLRELRALYAAAVVGAGSPLSELAVQYADFAVWQREHLAGEVEQHLLGFWRERLAHAPQLELPFDRPRPAVPRGRGGRAELRLGPAASRELQALSRAAGASLFMTLLAAWQVVLARITGQTDLVIGSPIAGRNRPEIEPLIGFFVNSLVMRTWLGDDPSFSALLERARTTALAAYAHQDLPFEKLVAELHPEREMGRNPLFQVMFALQNAPVPVFEVGALVLEPLALEFHGTHFDLECNFLEDAGGLCGQLVYDRDLFDATSLLRLAQRLRALLLELPAAAGRRISQLALATPAERHQLVIEVNDTISAYPREAGLAELFELQVARDPAAPAVVFLRAGTAPVRLSYGEIDRLGNRLAHRLIDLGVGPEALVALMMERGPTALWAIVGILKAGAAYLPLDPAYPERRLAMMIDDARPKVLLVDRAVGQELRAGGWQVLELDERGEALAGEPDEDPRRRCPALDARFGAHLAYAMYTSGSTGRPKGVMIEQRAIARLALGTDYARLGPRERIAQVSNISFDAATFEIWGAFLTGACLVGIETDVLLTPRVLEQTIAEHGISVLSVTMGPFHQTAREHPAAYAGVGQVFFGAETADPRLVGAVRAAMPGRLVHLYGPTESTSFATWHAVESVEEGRALPIGRPLANTRVLLLDRRLEPVPFMAAGEISLGGDGLARGYLHRPATTAERFVPDPAGGIPGARLYKTGDRARRLAGGAIEFLGRIDTQFKVRGFRIEPGEVESALEGHPAVADAVVMVREDVPGRRQLVAYVVQDPGYRHTGGTDPESSWRSDHVEEWQLLFDDAYAGAPLSGRSSVGGIFNIVGWKRATTGEPIPSREMREWLHDTVEAISELEPRRVLEIGCGTGLVLFQVAPACELYVGTDVARRGLEYIESQQLRITGGLRQVRLEERSADDFSGFAPGSFDLVILNSVIQYFPSAEYLVSVLDRALEVVAPGGAIFLGDVRSLPLAEAFQAEVALAQASDATAREELLRRVQTALLEEDELLVDPSFFAALAARRPRIVSAEVSPKRGFFHNELTRYRYQVMLRVESEAPRRRHEWIDWAREGLTLERLRRWLEIEEPGTLALTGIPNARLVWPLALLEALRAEDGPATVGELRSELSAQLAGSESAGIDPQALWALGRELPYQVLLSWAGHGRRGRLHAFLRRREQGGGRQGVLPVPPLPPIDPSRAWGTFTTRPLRGRFAHRVIPELRDYLQTRLPDYMMPAAFVLLDELPLNPNGKVDRRALPPPEIPRTESEEGWLAPRTDEEKVVAAIWAEVLGVERVGAEDDFFRLGGHSLLATRVISLLRMRLGVEVPLRALFQSPTVAGLAGLVANAAARGVPPIVPVPRPEDGSGLPLSFAQERLWFLDRLSPGNAFYLSPALWRLRGRLDVAALAASLGEIQRRHEVLRTTLVLDAGRPMQVVHPAGGFRLPVIDLERVDEGVAVRLAERESARPFDLAAEPPLRCALLRRSGEAAILVVNLHHVAADGWSHAVLLAELRALYAVATVPKPGGVRSPRVVTSPLPELAVQIADFALWQRGWLAGAELERQLGYWREQLAGAPATELLGDRPRPPVQRFRGAMVPFTLEASSVADPRRLAFRQKKTLFMVTLAAFQALLHRLTGERDVVVGSPIAGRNRREIEPLIGFFVNMLVLRSRLEASRDPAFGQLLEQTAATALTAYDHQDLPFEKLVEHLGLARDLARNPLFQLFFAFQEMPPAEVPMGDLTLEQMSFEIRSTRFDLELQVWEEDEGLVGMAVYDTDLFDPTTIRRLTAVYARLLAAAVEAPGLRLSRLSLLGAVESQQLLLEWNESPCPEPAAPTLGELVAVRAARIPDAVAVVGESAAVSYGELVRRAAQLAHRLRQLGAGAEVRIGVCLNRGSRLVETLLGVLQAGAAYVPLDPAYPLERLRFMLEDAAAPLVVAETATLELLPSGSFQILDLDRDLLQTAVDPAAPASPNNLAYLIYTSGSTGRPKAVAIEHRSATAFVAWVESKFTSSDLESVLAATSIAFDLSIFELFATLAQGGTVVLAKNALELAEQRDDGRFHRLTLVNTVPSAIAEILRAKALPASVRTVNLAGEALDGQLVAQLHRLGHVARVFNLYGPSEDTTYSTWAVIEPGERMPPIGRPLAGTRAAVLDRELRPLPLGTPGELFLGGQGLARGYLGRPATTAERFVPDPFADTPGARHYRTGDLARWRGDGQLEFLGRIDHQVKVRGFRVEPGEIEAVLETLPGVGRAVVVVHGQASAASLVAWVQPAPGMQLEPGRLREQLGGRLPAHLVPSAIVPLDQLPRTPSGKIDRAALGRQNLSRRVPAPAAAAVEPRTPEEAILAEIWAEVLGREQVGVLDGFFELGGHSLLATQAMARASEVLGVELPLRALFETPTVAGLAATVARLGETAADRLPPAPKIVPQPRAPGVENRFPVTFAQLREWILDRLESGSTVYNIAVPLRMRGVLDELAFFRALDQMGHRHEPLRTRFGEAPEEPVQVVELPRPRSWPLVDLGRLDSEASTREGERLTAWELSCSFDLVRGPLLRSLLVRLSPRERIWLLTFHHSISDGWSLGIFFRELDALYRAHAAGRPPADPAELLGELPVQYADFAVWQRRWLAGETLARIGEFWHQTLAGLPPVLELPADRPRPPVRQAAAGLFYEPVPAALLEACHARARAERATLFMVFLAALKTLLLRTTGQGDLAIGTFIANRNRTETAGIIGFFTNTLVLRTRLEPGDPARQAIAKVRDTALAAYAHQDLPFEKLLEVVEVERNPAFTPLFQVMLVLQNLPRLTPWLADLELTEAAMGARQADFDLELVFHPEGPEMVGEVKYAAALFDPTTVRRLMRAWRLLLETMVGSPEKPLAELPLLGHEERHQLLVEANDSLTTLADAGCNGVSQAFERQAARTPAALALLGNAGEALSYAELAARIHRLARWLRRLGVGPDRVVGLAVPRSVEMVVALFAVLEAGAAYLPIDSEHPAERIAWLLANSNARTLLTRRELVARLAEVGGAVLGVEDLETEARDESAEPLGVEIHPQSRAYVMYTSGSTGEPKGVEIPHRALINFLTVTDRTYGYVPGDRVLQFAALTFDTSVEEIFPSLCRGATLVLRPAERVEAPGDFLRRAAERALTVIDLPTAYWHELAAYPELALPEAVRLVIVGGEKAQGWALERWQNRVSQRVRLFNGYGPTEATVMAIACDLAGPHAAPVVGGDPPIGRPLPNVRIYLLDRGFQPVPMGVRGEITIAGPALARGYLGRPGATAERFVPEPWSGQPGARLYKTGDVARQRGDGAMEFTGRVDDQVKLRGLRVEPGEVGAVLAGHPGLDQAVVLARPLASGALGLVAYVVPRERGVEVAELRAFLKERLPEFLVPAVFVVLETLPMSSSNKVDRRALRRLPLPEIANTVARETSAPQSELERGLAKIWAEVLGLERVGVDDNFFDLGGNSLLILRLHRRLEEAGHTLKVLDLFRYPSVRALAGQLAPKEEEKPRFEKAKSLAEQQREARARRPVRPGPRR